MEEKVLNIEEQKAPVKKHRKPMKKSTRKALFGYGFISIWIIGFVGTDHLAYLVADYLAFVVECHLAFGRLAFQTDHFYLAQSFGLAL